MPDLLDDELAFIRNRDVSAGQWSFTHPTDAILTPENAAAELLDIEIDRIGQRRKRRGYTLIADDLGAVAIQGLVGFSPGGGSRVLVAETDGVVYTWDGLAGTWTSSLTGLTAPSDWTEFVVATNKLFRLGKTDNVRSFDGSTWTDEGNTDTDPPLGKIGIWTSTQRLIIANTTAAPNTLFPSSAGDPQTFARTTDAFQIGKNTVEGMTGLIEFTSLAVMAFTPDQMHFLDISNVTVSNWTRTKVADIGCVAPRTVRLIGEDGLFLSRDGVRSIIQSAQDKKRGASQTLSFPIQDWIDRINWANVGKAVAWVWQDKYYLAVPIDSATVNSHVLVWSRRAFEANGGRGGWTVWRNWGANTWAVQDFSTKARLYFGEATADGKGYQARSADPTDDATSDNGTAIEYSETGKRQDGGLPEVDKTFETIEVEAIAQAAGTLTVKAQIDGGGFTTIGTISQSEGLPTLPIDLPFDLKGENKVRGKFDLESLGRGRNIQPQILEGTLDADTALLGYTITAYIENVELE